MIDGDIMSKVTTALLDHEPDMKSFSCGEVSIDQMIGEAYLNHLIRKSMTFQIMFRGISIGYYQLTIENIYLGESNLEFADCGTGENKYGYLSINFLAIRKEIQRQGIGTSVLRHILSEAIELSKKWPIRLVYIEALQDKVEWYKSIGFENLYDGEPADKFGLVPMFYELMTPGDKEAFEDYCISKTV